MFWGILIIDLLAGALLWAFGTVSLFVAIAWFWRDLQPMEPSPRGLRIARHLYLALVEPLEALYRIRFHLCGIAREFRQTQPPCPTQRPLTPAE